MIAAGTINMGESIVLLVEAMGLREGVKKAIEMGYRRIEVEGDNTIVIQALRGEIEKPWKISNLIRDTGKFQNLYGIVNIRHTYREGNKTTDWIANAGHNYRDTMEWTSSPSLELDDILFADELGKTLERRAA